MDDRRFFATVEGLFDEFRDGVAPTDQANVAVMRVNTDESDAS